MVEKVNDGYTQSNGACFGNHKDCPKDVKRFCGQEGWCWQARCHNEAEEIKKNFVKLVV